MLVLEPAEEILADRLAEAVVARRLTVPAVLLLESMKPVSFLGGQALRFFEPLVATLFDRAEYGVAAAILEDRDKLEDLLRRIERGEAAHERARSQPGAAS